MRPLFSLQGPRRREGRQPRFPEDLVAVGVADPGQIPLRPQEALQLHPGLIEHRGEGFRGERRIQRLYAQAADRLGLLNLLPPPAEQTPTLLWSQPHQPEIFTAVELEDQRHVLCGAPRRGGDRQPPVALGVDDHDQRAGEGEEGGVPPPPHILDRPPPPPPRRAPRGHPRPPPPPPRRTGPPPAAAAPRRPRGRPPSGRRRRARRRSLAARRCRHRESAPAPGRGPHPAGVPSRPP